MIKPDLQLPIDLTPPPGLVRLREDAKSGVVDYTFCAGVSPAHARDLAAQARAINLQRKAA
ncbi:MAG: hypothetical protein ACI8PT_003998 [Gammaproteobacteria bacterium]|jgi:hypothetical protein